MKNSFVPTADKVAAHAPRGSYKAWLAVEAWRLVDERKELRVQFMVVPGIIRDVVELR